MTIATILGAQAILTNTADIVVAGGMESMSNTPYYLPKARYGYKFGNSEIIDGVVRDGLQDAYKSCMMGDFAEITAKQYNITRELSFLNTIL